MFIEPGTNKIAVVCGKHTHWEDFVREKMFQEECGEWNKPYCTLKINNDLFMKVSNSRACIGNNYNSMITLPYSFENWDEKDNLEKETRTRIRKETR